MFKAKDYVRVQSLEEAYELNQKKNNMVLGGMLWMKMSNRNLGTVIDLGGLGLDKIRETQEQFEIGCMTTLRDLELHEGLQQAFDGFIRDSVCHIVGTQFRNVATVGGSVFGRYGFSDVLTALLVLDTYVELHQGGIVPLKEFVHMKRDNDILVQVIIKKNDGKAAYEAKRRSATDFPVLTAACARTDAGWCVSIGARPGKAVRIEDGDQLLKDKADKKDVKTFLDAHADEIIFGTNMRGSSEYRRHLAEVLVFRALRRAGGTNED